MLQAMPSQAQLPRRVVAFLSVLALASKAGANPQSADTDFNDDGDSRLFWSDYSAEGDNPSTDTDNGEFKSLFRPDSPEDDNPSTGNNKWVVKSLLRPYNSARDDIPITGTDNGDINGFNWPDISELDDNPSAGVNNRPDGNFRGDFSATRINPEGSSEITTQSTTQTTSESTTTPTVSEDLLIEENRTMSRLRRRLLRFQSAVTPSSGAGGAAALKFDPYVGQWVPCKSKERECLRFGTLFDPQRGRCVLKADEWCHSVPTDRRPALADGRLPLVASCPPGCASQSPSPPNASAGAAGSAQCRAASWGGRAVACACQGGLAAPRPLTVGGFACICTEGEGQGGRAIEQPSKGRRCRVPALHLPWTEGSPLDPRRSQALLKSPLPLRCDVRQQLCARNHTVWAWGTVGCQPLLQRPSSVCPEGQWLALDANAALQGDLRAHCVPRDGGCEAEAKAKGESKAKGRWRRALFDGRCHRLSSLRLLLPAPPRPTLFGEYHAPHTPLRLWLRERHNDSEAACELRHAAPDEPTDEPTATTPAPAPQPNATAASLKYRRFHAADGFVGAPIACSYEQKVCFRHNTLFNPASGRCLPIAGHTNAPLLADADELLRSGQLVAKGTLSLLPDPCIGYRMAYDGRCYPKELVKQEVCGCDAEPTPHFLGGVECRCAATPAIRVSQPPEAGHCRIPDLRFPDHHRSFLFDGSPPEMYQAICSRSQHSCFAQGKVWLSDPDGCYPVNERGPCPPDHTLVLTDFQKSAECVRGCPSGQDRMAFDGQCHERREIQVLLPPYAQLSVLTVRGQRLVDPAHYEVQWGRLSVDGDRCTVKHGRLLPSHEPWAQFSAPPCGAGDGKVCLLYEVHSRPPTVDDFEDY